MNIIAWSIVALALGLGSGFLLVLSSIRQASTLDQPPFWWAKSPFWWPDPRFIIALIIIAGFAFAYIRNPDDTMKGALIAAFAGAWGYWLGSSKGASEANNRADVQADTANKLASVAASPITTTTTVGVSETEDELRARAVAAGIQGADVMTTDQLKAALGVTTTT